MICAICQEAERPVEPGWLVCSRDYWRLSNALRAIPDLVAEIRSLGYVQRDHRGEHGFAAVDKSGGRLPHFDQIAHALPAGPVNGRTGAPRVSGSNGRPLPIRIDPTDLTAPVRPASTAVHARSPWPADQIGWLSVATELDFWAADWATARNERRPDPQVPVLCRWLGDRLDWACTDHGAVDEFAAKVSGLYGALMAAVGGWEPRPETLTAPCRSCGILALYRQVGPRPEFDRVACAACPSLLTEGEYGEYVRGLYEAEVARRRKVMVTAEDILYVLNGGAPVVPDEYEFAVITAGSFEAVGTGRMQGKIVTLTEEHFGPFARHEVLVLDKEEGREPSFTEGRKPAKWSVEYETFPTLAEALERAAQLAAAASQPEEAA